ncbi:maker714 [Drosophila busckii]|uniref:Maker714 n=1 Tax=Drosophila busckii TaxID=30019 RepID=A0A0M4EEF7_DROBS|nr:maker714 [Drosophila busckii]
MICRAVALQLQPTSSIKNANLTTLEFIYMFQDINLHVPISEHQKIWQHPQFDANRKLVILASGWRNTVNESNSVGLISQALIELGNVNVVVVDVANLVDTFYMWSALNTNTIGDLIGEALKRLIELVPAQSKEIHLIGKFLGLRSS